MRGDFFPKSKFLPRHRSQSGKATFAHQEMPPTCENAICLWLGASCDYHSAHRFGAGAYVAITPKGERLEGHVCGKGTTEYRMLLSVLVDFVEKLSSGQSVVVLTNVPYLQYVHADLPAKADEANVRMFEKLRQASGHLASLEVRLVPYRKHPLLAETHRMAHEAMLHYRRQGADLHDQIKPNENDTQ